jgi:hypothetical protein
MKQLPVLAELVPTSGGSAFSRQMLLNSASWTSTFPMVRAGGLFILIMGAGVVAGAALPARRRSLLILGGAIATAAIILFAGRLSAPFGRPSQLQLWFLFGSIALEIVLIRLAVARYRLAGERTLLLAILFVVGLHFLPMAVAFGPLCIALGLVLCGCSAIGLWFRPTLPLNRMWALDGVIKIAFGAAMFLVK